MPRQRRKRGKYYPEARLVGKGVRGLDSSSYYKELKKYHRLWSSGGHPLQEPGSHKEANPVTKTIQQSMGAPHPPPNFTPAPRSSNNYPTSHQAAETSHEQHPVHHSLMTQQELCCLAWIPIFFFFFYLLVWTIALSQAWFNYKQRPGFGTTRGKMVM